MHQHIRLSWLLLFVALAIVGLGSTANAAEPDGRPSAAESAEIAPGVVNINTATQEELERLPGIGPSKAQAILETRGKLRGFRRVQDILRVRGIGRATFRKLRPMLTVDGPTTLVERPRRTART